MLSPFSYLLRNKGVRIKTHKLGSLKKKTCTHTKIFSRFPVLSFFLSLMDFDRKYKENLGFSLPTMFCPENYVKPPYMGEGGEGGFSLEHVPQNLSSKISTIWIISFLPMPPQKPSNSESKPLVWIPSKTSHMGLP